MSEAVVDSAGLRRTAMDHLARREHSRYELLVKLQKKYPDAPSDVLSSVLDKLERDKLLSDDRFTEAYVHYRKGKGYGPLHIRQHLQTCRVDPDLISAYLPMDDPQWLEILRDLLRRKFPESQLTANTSCGMASDDDAECAGPGHEPDLNEPDLNEEDLNEEDLNEEDLDYPDLSSAERRNARQAQWLQRQKRQQKIQRFVLSRGFTLEQLSKT